MIDPSKEISSLKDEVRSGFKTLPEAIRERGLDPDQLIEEASEFNKKLDELGLIFDTDPRQINGQGMKQMSSQPTPSDPNSDQGETDSGQANDEDASQPSGKGGAQQSQSGR